MTTSLIVRLSTLLLLAGCCDTSTGEDCSDRMKADIADVGKPHLVSEKDGVRLYVTNPCYGCYPVYFTTPCGDASWTERHSHGKTSEYLQNQVNGTGCK